ncbi:MAG: DNA-3-methyladenine glycosylase I [Clostridia bacterium]|nr:DNA-3-methyladenine glycosylase I [Clostridia bacterium]
MPKSSYMLYQIARAGTSVGAVTIYSHLQACGIINDHDKECPCRQKINSENPTVKKRRDNEVK